MSPAAALGAAAGDAAAAEREREREFREWHYGGGARRGSDVLFCFAYAVMCLLLRKFSTTPPARPFISAAIVINAACGMLAAANAPLYRRARLRLVLWHSASMVVLRACCVNAMATAAAVLWRAQTPQWGGAGPAPTQAQAPPAAAEDMWIGLLSMSGAIMRLWEVLGLPQPLRREVVLSLLLVVPLQAPVGFSGFRMAYANSGFLVLHELNDGAAALFDALLSLLAGLPAGAVGGGISGDGGGGGVCSACPGPALFATVLLWAGVVLPLYLAWNLEAAARRRFARRRQFSARSSDHHHRRASDDGADSDADAVDAAAGDVAAAAMAAAASTESLRSSLLSLSSSSSSAAEAAVAASQGVAAAPHRGLSAAQLVRCWRAAEAEAEAGSWLHGGVVHAAALLSALLALFLLASAASLSLLPRVLTPAALARLCPVRPPSPFLISAQATRHLV